MPALPEIKDPFDPIAFVVALVSAPFLVAGAGFWLLFIPVVAAIAGLPAYLICGTPVLLWMVGRFEPRFASFAVAGFLTDLAACLMCLAAEKQGLIAGYQGYSVILGFGLIFAPAWTGTFAVAYRLLYRPARLAGYL